jgi:hypothetical protein
VIYPAVLAAWTYLALFFVNRPLGGVISAIVFMAGLAGILLYDRSLKRVVTAVDEPQEPISEHR